MAHELGASDWDDWLPTAVADASPDGVAIWYLGCNGFILKASDGTTLFIDVYLGLGDPPRTLRMIPVPFDPEDVQRADAVLATHEHNDHVHGPSTAPILAATGAQLYAPAPSIEKVHDEGWTESWAVDDDQLATVSAGETVDVGAFTIHVEPATDPDAAESVGYVIEHEAGTFFHGGDARPGGFDGVAERHDVDLGALAFGSAGQIMDKETREPKYTAWYNDENMIVQAAAELELDRLLPTHWDVWKGLTADPTALEAHVRSFAYPRRLEYVEIGDRVDL